MHDHGLDTHVTAGALDAQGDLSAVGNQNFLEHDFDGRFFAIIDMGIGGLPRRIPLAR
jgi:hypothetical protein